jgi:N-acyl-D-amino-acid deacylase
MFDVLIKGGFVIDGTGSPMAEEDIAIKGDEILETGRLDSAEAAEIIDAVGCYVCPGFIDIHSHSDFNILVRPQGQSKIQQGVTTEVCGNCGLSASPLLGMARQQREKSLKAFGLDITWSTLKEFVEVIGEKKLLSNIVPLVGHGNIRGSVIGYENRVPSPEEMKKMVAMLEQEMESGAWGLSSGLIYPPGVYAGQKELVGLAQVVRRFGGIYASHIRNEGDFVIEAIEEALNIGKCSGIPMQISHLKTMGKRNWDKLPSVFARIEKAIDEGVAVTADRYPYTAAGTGLDSVLPSWACQGGAEAELERLRSSSLRDEIFSDILKNTSEREIADDITISRVFSQKNKFIEGKTLAQASELRKQTVKDALFDLLIEEGLDVDAILFYMSEENLKKIMRKDYVMVGSDSSVWDTQGPLSAGKPHPRGFGTFPRFIRKYVFEENVLSLEDAVKKMTGQPAEKMGFVDRGFVKKGCKADIVIFKKEDLRDNSTYESPHGYPSGIIRVMVNGRWVLAEGNLTGAYPGIVLLKNR